MKIAFFDTKPYDKEAFERLNKEYNFEFTFFESRLKKSSVSLAKGHEAVCVFVRDEVDKEVINELVEKGVKLIALRCAGFNNVDLEAACNKIKVVRVPAYSPYAVAEFTVTLMLALNRKIHKSYIRTKEANFLLNGLTGFDMHGKTVGLIGTGKIAKVLIKILIGFGMKVIAYDLYPDKEAAKELGYDYVSLDELYKQSDIISLHCPLTKDTEHIINEESISKMRKGVMIINTGRGKLIDTADLVQALKNKHVGAAGLDVYEEEEHYFYTDHSEKIMKDDVLSRLLMFPNVLITSHQAFLTQEALTNIATTTLESFKEFKAGETLSNEITINHFK